MSELPRLSFDWPNGADPEEVLTREWLVTNGLGGYASGTVSGCNTRRYHGVFVPTLSGFGRTVVLPKLEEHATAGGVRVRLDAEELIDGRHDFSSARVVRRFELHGLIPRWTWSVNGTHLSRRVVMVHGENTLFIEWENLGQAELTLTLRPWPTFRFHDRPMNPEVQRTLVRLCDDQVEFSLRDDAPNVRLRVSVDGEAIPFVGQPRLSERHLYRIERRRGLDDNEHLKSPGYFELLLRPGQRGYFAVTTEDWHKVELDPAPFFTHEHEREARLLARAPEHCRAGTAARLALAADQFIIDPSMRVPDASWARATAQDVRSVIAGYHWFTDWGRDTMISLDGLTLHTGRWREAAAILRTFQHYVKDGLLPNLFPEGEAQGLYHTADATLWFFHAIDRYLVRTDDEELLRDLFPTLEGIVRAHVQGTHYGIHIDPADGLLTQGQEGYQLTWMDAKVDGWVVTPRRGKAVELNALWFNAMKHMEGWARRVGKDPVPYSELAEKCGRSFNARFWNEAKGCLFDLVDKEGGGNDDAVRPNQVFSISLPHPVLARERWKPVLDLVERELLTPVGLRTLSPSHPDYKPRYDGDLRARDAAYHQGTVWPWLLGHFIDAWLKQHGDKAEARRLVMGLNAHLSDTAVGQLSEIFDAEAPFHARGCIAQAWSIAETLRAWVATQH